MKFSFAKSIGHFQPLYRNFGAIDAEERARGGIKLWTLHFDLDEYNTRMSCSQKIKNFMKKTA